MYSCVISLIFRVFWVWWPNKLVELVGSFGVEKRFRRGEMEHRMSVIVKWTDEQGRVIAKLLHSKRVT